MMVSILLFNSIDVKKYIDKNIGWCLTFVIYIYKYMYSWNVLKERHDADLI